MPHCELDINAHREHLLIVLTESTNTEFVMIVARDIKPKTMRFPKDIQDFFLQEAVENGRSFNSEVMQALKEKMDERKNKKH